MNAMALDTSGNFVDPFGGRYDLANKVLRHVSDSAFVEDPVRVLRLARFAARFPDFTVDPSTVQLVETMRGELTHLTAERVWKELSRALTETEPRRFFDVLLDCNVLDVLFPEVFNLLACTESPKWHPEGNTFEHTMLVLTAASKLNPGSLVAAFNALTHDFGKAEVPAHLHPKFFGHADLGMKPVAAFCDRLKVPADLKKTAVLVCKFHMHMHQLNVMKATTFVKMFDAMDAWRNEAVVEDLVNLGMADHRGRLGFHNADVGQLFKLVHFHAAASSVKFADLGVAPPPATKPERVKDLFARARAAEVAKWMK